MPALLLDTHALLWWLAGDKKLPTKARKSIAKESAEIFVSAASGWEVATKVRLGKIPGVSEVLDSLEDEIHRQKFRILAVSFAHAVRAGSFEVAHRDPFDRMLAAQALSEELTIVSGDVELDAFGIRRLWD